MNKHKATIPCAIIGIGSMGKKYALMLDRNEIEGLKLAAVCCRSDENAAWAESNLSSFPLICRSEDELYQHSELFDAVLVVTPHKQHPAMTIRALQAGKHVMCDKPAGVTAADAEAMNAAAESSGKIYAMMCHQRTYPQHMMIKELLENGTIGQISRIFMENSHFYRTEFYHHSGSWRSSWQGEGGGALINQGYHLLDLWQYLFGLPMTLYTDIPFGKYNNFDVDDEATIIMDYPDKMTGTFILTTGEGSDTERFEIIGTKGKILLEGNILRVTRFSLDTGVYGKTAAVTSRQNLHETVEEYTFNPSGKAYHLMLQNFASAILNGEPLTAPGQDSAKTLSLINAAYLSAWQEKKIQLPINMEEYILLLRQKESNEIR